MSELSRFTVSLESDLLERFDRFREEGQFATRSDAVRQLIRDALTARACADGAEDAAATLTLVYDHHKAGLPEKLLELQHRHGDLVVASLHVHLSHDVCMEVIALRGRAAALRQVADGLRGLKGIHKGELVMATASGS